MAACVQYNVGRLGQTPARGAVSPSVSRNASAPCAVDSNRRGGEMWRLCGVSRPDSPGWHARTDSRRYLDASSLDQFEYLGSLWPINRRSRPDPESSALKHFDATPPATVGGVCTRNWKDVLPADALAAHILQRRCDAPASASSGLSHRLLPKSPIAIFVRPGVEVSSTQIA